MKTLLILMLAGLPVWMSAAPQPTFPDPLSPPANLGAGILPVLDLDPDPGTNPETGGESSGPPPPPEEPIFPDETYTDEFGNVWIAGLLEVHENTYDRYQWVLLEAGPKNQKTRNLLFPSPSMISGDPGTEKSAC